MSKIEKIEVFVFRYPQHYKIGGHEDAPGRFPGTDYYLEPQWPQAYSRMAESCLVKVSSDDGLAGWGEAQSPVTPQTPAAILTTLLGPSLLEQDFRDTAVLYERMCQLMLVRGHVGSFLFDALAALDTALWDLKGRYYNEPLYRLLGGARRLELPAYVSGLRQKTLEEKLEAARSFIARGFAGVKIFTGADVRKAADEMRALRSELSEGVFLALDALWACDRGSARRLGRMLDAAEAAWFEAPLAVEDVKGHAALAQVLDTPVAGGEALRSVSQFRPWLEAGALDLAQPDVMRAGITGVMRIAELAAVFHVPTTLHVGVCTGIGIAATWQVAAALPGVLPQEHQVDLFDAMNTVLENSLTEEKGRLQVPSRAGIGVVVNESAVRSMAVETWVVDREGRRLVEEKHDCSVR